MQPSPSKPTNTPYISAGESLPEITLKALLLGMLLSAVLAGANAYLGLKVGMTVSASIPAAVLSMALLKLFRRSNILENNLVQTAASAGESLAAGAIFTLPALILLGAWDDFHYFEVTAITLVGGILGVLFSIPLRRVLVVEGNLTFPEGLATAEVLISGDRGGQGVRRLALAGCAGALVKLCQSGFRLLGSSVSGGFQVGGSVFAAGCDLSPALLAVGYILKLRVAVLVFGGGVIAWGLALPIYTALHGLPVDEAGQALSGYEAAITVWSTKIRYLGVGAMFVGGLWALVSLLKPLARGIRSSLAAHRAAVDGSAGPLPRTERDLSMRAVGIGIILCLPPLVGLTLHLIDREALGISGGTLAGLVLAACLLAVFGGFLFSAVAGYMAGLVGSSNNPVSGVTIATLLTTSLLFLVILGGSTAHPAQAAAAVILVGAIVCCAAAISGDNLQDLKAGHVVGATPVRQQILQLVGVGASALVLSPVLGLLYKAYGFGDRLPRPGMDPTEALAAPQATLMQSVALGVFSRDLPWGLIMVGGVIAVLIITADQVQRVRGASFRIPVLAVAVGIYLPVELTVPILLGGLVAAWAGRRHSDGLLVASGLIAGEALAGIMLAIPFALAGSTRVLQVVPDGFSPVAGVLGVVVLLGLAAWLYRADRSTDPA